MVTKEQTQPAISEEALHNFSEVVDRMQRREEELRQSTPEAPDESGEIGRYNEDASNWFGGQFVYKTETGRYFAYTGEGYIFVNPIHLESYLASLKRKSPK